MYCKIATRRSFRLYFLFLKLVRVVAAPIRFKKKSYCDAKKLYKFFGKNKNMLLRTAYHVETAESIFHDSCFPLYDNNIGACSS